MVYRIEHSGVDELVIKTPLFSDITTSDDQLSTYEQIFYECQTLKLNCYKNGIAQVKEELIELNSDEGIITGYIVIVE